MKNKFIFMLGIILFGYYQITNNEYIYGFKYPYMHLVLLILSLFPLIYLYLPWMSKLNYKKSFFFVGLFLICSTLFLASFTIFTEKKISSEHFYRTSTGISSANSFNIMTQNLSNLGNFNTRAIYFIALFALLSSLVSANVFDKKENMKIPIAITFVVLFVSQIFYSIVISLLLYLSYSGGFLS